MSRMIVPVPDAEKVRVHELVPGDWISDGQGEAPLWHQVLEIDAESVLLGDALRFAQVVPADPDGWILRLRPEDRPRM